MFCKMVQCPNSNQLDEQEIGWEVGDATKLKPTHLGTCSCQLACSVSNQQLSFDIDSVLYVDFPAEILIAFLRQTDLFSSINP